SLGLEGYIASNGSYAEIDGKIMFDYPIENIKLTELLEYFDDNKIDYILEGQKESYVVNITGGKIREIIDEANIEEGCFVDKYAFMKHPGGKSFEMYIGKYTKGYGIEQLITKLGISKEDTYAFGDGENDIEMFQFVKYGIAMGGHHERLKEHAYDFTENVENEGIYEGLKKLKLI
ncbi:MAG: HAD hydrolase family protein, partial [Coprobacillus sp.]